MTDIRRGDLVRDTRLFRVDWLDSLDRVQLDDGRYVNASQLEVVERPKPKYQAGDKLTRVAQLDDLPGGSVVVRQSVRRDFPHFMPVYKDIATGSWLIPGDRQTYSSSEIHVLPAVVLRVPE